MRHAILCIVVAACDLQPAPKQQPAKPEVTEAPAGSGAPVLAKPMLETSQTCTEIGVHVADVLISGVHDPAEKGIYEQERTKIVRSTAEACTLQTWPAAELDCFLRAQTSADVHDCQAKFPPPVTVRPKPPAK